VVATDIGGNAETVVDGVTGVVVPPRHPGALAAAILDLIENSGKAGALGMAGRDRALRLHGRDAMIAATIRTYENHLTASGE
jgi:glycosyltransferase involved in cell wall biosynthesis